ncbi:MAG: anti-sigma factor family protein, partial [Terriglobales bacterium]
MNIPVWNCSEFESALSDYRDGTLRLERAAAARDHLTSCDNCAALLAGVAQAVAAVQALPQVDPPARLLTNVLAQTLPAHTRPRGKVPASLLTSAWRRMWRGVATPRFAMGMA